MATQVQVIIIHGGTTFKTKSEYIQNLRKQTIDVERLRPKPDWKQTIQKDLGSKYTVLCPKMPNSTNAQYKEWKMWFINILKVVNKEIILVGHSLGGVFLAKFLSENIIDKKIRKLIFVAAPFTDTANEPLASFSLKKGFSKLEKQALEIYLLHSTDDIVVPFENSLMYKKKIFNARLVKFNGKGHFNQDSFSELVKIIRA